MIMYVMTNAGLLLAMTRIEFLGKQILMEIPYRAFVRKRSGMQHV